MARAPQYHWTLVGTNTGAGGSGHRVRISGFEEWTIGDDGLIASSLGHFNQVEYDRQISTRRRVVIEAPRTGLRASGGFERCPVRRIG